MKKFQVFFCITLIFMLGIFFSNEASAIAFSDVKETAWYAKDLKVLIDNGIVSGFPDGTFKPQSSLTREQFVSLLVRVITGKNFPGVVNNWSKGNLDEARRRGFIEKDGAKVNRYYVDAISRGEAAQMIGNVLDSLGENYANDYKKFENIIRDKETFPEEMFEGIIKSYYKGIIIGYPDRKFEYSKNITRAEAVAILYRIMDKEQRLSIGELSSASIQTLLYKNSNTNSGRIYDELDKEKTNNFIVGLQSVSNANLIIDKATRYVEIIEYGLNRLLYRNNYALYQSEYESICGKAPVQDVNKKSTYSEFIRSKYFASSGKTDVGYAVFSTNPKLIYLSTFGTIRIKGIVRYSYDVAKSEGISSDKLYEKNVEVELIVDKDGNLYAKQLIELK